MIRIRLRGEEQRPAEYPDADAVAVDQHSVMVLRTAKPGAFVVVGRLDREQCEGYERS